MNAAQRKTLEEIKATLAELQSDEQEKFDNLPESLQQSEQGQRFEEGANYLQEAIDALDNIQ